MSPALAGQAADAEHRRYESVTKKPRDWDRGKF
jgi:hypothetical protein